MVTLIYIQHSRNSIPYCICIRLKKAALAKKAKTISLLSAILNNFTHTHEIHGIIQSEGKIYFPIHY